MSTHEPTMMKYWLELKGRILTLPAWLLVIDAIAIGMCTQLGFNIVFFLSQNPDVGSCFAPVPDQASYVVYIVITGQYLLTTLTYPFIGWLADTKIGRERAINLSLWSCWFGTLLQCISYCIQYGTCGLPVNIAKYGISGIAFILISIGTAAFYSNVLAYGLDQLVYKSNAHVRAFVHWIVWGWFVGFSNGYIAFVEGSVYDVKLIMITAIFTFAVSSLALCLSICFHYKFEPSGILKNDPYKMVYSVLKYAWHHKIPQRRSALTYWENAIPSRVDLGKTKYGGPFSEETVESVKTFWRIVFVLLSTFGFYTTYYHTVANVLSYTNTLKGATTTLDGYGSYALFSAFNESVVIIVPLMELVVFPLFPKLEFFFLNSLKGFGINYILIFLSLVAVLLIDTIGHLITSDVPCYLFPTSRDYNFINISFLYYAISFIFSGLVDSISLIFILEFICRQTPVDMSGMLNGIFWLIRAAYINLGSFIQYFFFAANKNDVSGLSCSFWILFVQMVLCIIGFFVFVFAAFKYKRRKRKEEYDVHIVVEDTYVRILDENSISLL